MAAKPKAVSVGLESKLADRDSLVAALDHILKLGGCPKCGRASILKVDFGDLKPLNQKFKGGLSTLVQK